VLKIEYFTLNFGPQHPAAHGVLRLILFMSGEVIKKADPHIGLLHRGTEKLIEYKTFLQAIPYFARLDYVSTISQEHVFCLVIEHFLNLEILLKNSLIRIVFLELTRILNHLLALTTHALDVGAMTPFLWGFEEREKILEFFERISGARLHTSYFRFGGIQSDLNIDFLNDIFNFVINFNLRLNEVEELLNSSRIWKERLIDIGIVTFNNSIKYSFTGPLLRSSVMVWDLRKILQYECYDNFLFKVPFGLKGDCYDRYLIRLEEMYQSVLILIQTLFFLLYECNYYSNIPIKKEVIPDFRIELPSKNIMKHSMEELISHFKLYSEGFSIDSEEFYCAAETPKGEFGVFVETDGSNKPYRCKIRAPGFFHLQGLNFMTYNHLLADVVTIIGTQDIVFGEIDR
jgi:NADH dehydrogenase I D subunit